MARTPSLFVGHGSPANALKDNVFTETWAELGRRIPRPRAVLAISAHWYVEKPTMVTAMAQPRTIHDFGRTLPAPLFDQQYPSPGSPEVAARVQELLAGFTGVTLDHEWGLDHGTWAVLLKMYPKYEVPVVQLSIDARQPAAWHYELGQRLAPLRDEGVLIFGSGNVVHNFQYLDRNLEVTEHSVDWVEEWCGYVRGVLLDRSLDRRDVAGHPLVQWEAHPLGLKANPSPSHWLPVLYVLGTADETEPIRIVSEGYEAGTLAMMTFIVGEASE